MHKTRRALQAVLCAAPLWLIGGLEVHAADASPSRESGNAAASGDAASNEWREKLRRPAPAAQGNALFETKSWLPPEPPPRRPVARAPEPPRPPAFPYQFLGRLETDGQPRTVYLTKQNEVYAAVPGEVIEGTYRVLDVTPESMEVLYLPLNMKQQIAFSSIVPAPAAASRQGSRTPDAPSIVAPTSVSIPPPMNLSPPMDPGRGAAPAAQTSPVERPRSAQRQNTPDASGGERENTAQQAGAPSGGPGGTAANPGTAAAPPALAPSPVVVSPPTLSAFGASVPAQGAQQAAPPQGAQPGAPAATGTAPASPSGAAAPNAQPAGRM